MDHSNSTEQLNRATQQSNSTEQINANTMKRGASKHVQRYSHEAHKVGPHSRPNNLIKIDGRTKEAALMRQVRAELTAHVGGRPTAVQRALIERCVWLSLRLVLLDRKIASGRDFTEIDSNTYLAWSNSYTRTLARLGFEPAHTPRQQESLDEYLERLDGGEAA